MDACYGRNVHGYSWADDDDDDVFDIEAFKATAVNFEYYSSSTSGSDEAASDGIDDGEDSSSPTTSSEDSGNEDYDEHDIPPRPSTPEPTLLTGARDYDEHDSPLFRREDDDDDERKPSSHDAATTQATAPTPAHPHKKLPAPPAFYLQTPFEYDRPPGLPPNTLYYLEYSAPWKPAYEELVWEGASSYAGAYRDIKVQRAMDCRKTIQLFGSPLRREVKYEVAEDAYQEELEEDVWEDEVGMIGKWEIEQGEAKTGKTFAVYKDGGEIKKAVEEDIEGSAREGSDVAAAVATPSPTKLTLEDGLAHKAQQTKELDSASADDGYELEKRDSVHEEYDIGLFSDNESLSRSTTPESSVIVSTDDEIDVVKDSPFVLPLDEEHRQEDVEVTDTRDSLLSALPMIATTTTEEEQKDQMNTFPFSAVRSAWSQSAANITACGGNPPPYKVVLVTPITHVKGLKSPVLKDAAVNKIIRFTNSHDSTPTSTPPQVKKNEDLARHLETLYRIRQASKKHCRRLGSGILYALAHLPKC